MVGEKLGATVDQLGQPGTSPWHAFMNYDSYEHKQDVDVVVFAWSDKARLYHSHVSPICHTTVADPSIWPDLHSYNKSVMEAAMQYYSYLYDDKKATVEMEGLFRVMDSRALDYPHIKFIHMFCYADNVHDGLDIYKSDRIDELKYIYSFKNGVNIQPALMTLSYNDGWPSDIRKETRECHLTPKMHEVLAEGIYNAITNANNGDTVIVKLP
jgi:hypothetical protein